MRRMISTCGVICALLFTFNAVVGAQGPKTAPGKAEPKAAEKPSTSAPESQPAPTKAAPKEDLHTMLNQLENVSKALHSLEQTAIEGDPALQAEKQAILDEIQQTVEKIRAFEEKVDDKVVAASPDSKPLVQEKRDLVAKLESLPQGKRGGMMGMGRLLKWIYGDKQAARGKGEHRGKGAGKK